MRGKRRPASADFSSSTTMSRDKIRPMSFSSTHPRFAHWRQCLRGPWPAILAWATWSLLALGWFGYRDAWLGVMCIAPR
jgi:hypothetical protein